MEKKNLSSKIMIGTGIAVTIIGVGLIVGPIIGAATKDYSEETNLEDDTVDGGICR